jgi:hypothetical protein
MGWFNSRGKGALESKKREGKEDPGEVLKSRGLKFDRRGERLWLLSSAGSMINWVKYYIHERDIINHCKSESDQSNYLGLSADNCLLSKVAIIVSPLENLSPWLKGIP